MTKTIIGVDLGGTQMRVAQFDDELNLLDRLAEPTRAKEGPDRVLPRLLDLIERALPADRDSVVGIGLSVPGPINPHEGTIIAPPNLPGWSHMPVRKVIQDRFGCPTHLGNDANVAALAEATQGAARGFTYVIYLTVSTGIGSGIIDDGHLVLGSRGLGGEAGHMMLVVDGEVLDLERAASGPAIARAAVKRLSAGERSLIRDLANGKLERVTGKIVGEAAAQGDALAVEIIRRAGYLVGLGIVTLMHLFNPQIIVVGGSVTKTGDLLFDPMRQAVQQHALDPDYWQNVPIVPAALGDNVALIGAAALVRTRGGSCLQDLEARHS
jgi:glucokinase